MIYRLYAHNRRDWGNNGFTPYFGLADFDSAAADQLINDRAFSLIWTENPANTLNVLPGSLCSAQDYSDFRVRDVQAFVEYPAGNQGLKPAFAKRPQTFLPFFFGRSRR